MRLLLTVGVLALCVGRVVLNNTKGRLCTSLVLLVIIVATEFLDNSIGRLLAATGWMDVYRAGLSCLMVGILLTLLIQDIRDCIKKLRSA